MKEYKLLKELEEIKENGINVSNGLETTIKELNKIEEELEYINYNIASKIGDIAYYLRDIYMSALKIIAKISSIEINIKRKGCEK